MIKIAMVRAVLGYCDSLTFSNTQPDAATVATLRSKWSAL